MIEETNHCRKEQVILKTCLPTGEIYSKYLVSHQFYKSKSKRQRMVTPAIQEKTNEKNRNTE